MYIIAFKLVYTLFRSFGECIWFHTLLSFYLERAHSDYNAVDVDLVFDASTVGLCVSLATIEDSFFEEDEEFFLTLTTSDPDVVVNPEVATITILNDDRQFYVANGNDR